MDEPANIEESFQDDVVEELLFKILVIGDFGVGKTAIVRRYTSGAFSPHYKITIGVDFLVKTLQWNRHQRITLQLWDIAGHERFGALTRVYYKYATAAIIVYDLSRTTTFHSVLKWKEDLLEKVESQEGFPIPVILIANKCDIHGTTIPTRMLRNFCQEHKFDGWFFTSAKENINIDEAVRFLVGRALSYRKDVQNDRYSGQNSANSADSAIVRLQQWTASKPVIKARRCCQLS